MSRISSKRMPRKHDLVIGVVNKITNHGVYVTLKEYAGVEGYIHVSEVTGAWVRNIRNFVRQDQQVVGKVLRVNKNSNQIDISLKRVSDQLKKAKINEYRKQNSALALIKIIASKLNMDAEEVRDLLEPPFLDEFGSLYNGFEELAFSGIEVLDFMELDDEKAKIIHESAEMSIQISTVEITADLAVRSFAPDGVQEVKKLLTVAEEVANTFPEITSEITTIGSPQYRIHLEGRSFQELTEVYNEIDRVLKEESQDLDLEYRIVQNKN